MRKLKHLLIRLADWVDHRVLGHRFDALCQMIALSDWWYSDEDYEQSYTFMETIQRALQDIHEGRTYPIETLWDELDKKGEGE